MVPLGEATERDRRHESLVPRRRLELDRHLEPHAHRASREASRREARRPDIVLCGLIEPRIATHEHAHRAVFDPSGRVDHRFDDDAPADSGEDRKSTRLNSSHGYISYAVFCLKKKKEVTQTM